MNVVDLFFIFLFIGALALGFFQGMIRQIILIVVFYVSVLLASIYFSAIASFLQQRFSTNRTTAEYVGFAIVLTVSFIFLTAAGFYTFRYAEMPGQLLYLDRIVGLLLSAILGGLLIGILSILLWDIMIVAGGQNTDLPFARFLGRSVRTSFLLRYFAEVILPQTYHLIAPILPAEAERIFLLPQ